MDVKTFILCSLSSTLLYADAVFVTDHANGTIYLFDSTHPTTPTPFTSLPTGHSATGIAISGHTAYVTDSLTPGNIYAFDLINPANPATLLTTMSGTLSAFSIAIADKTAYITTATTGGIFSFNTAHPTTPTLITTMPAGHPAGNIAISDQTAYVNDAGFFPGSIYSFNTVTPAAITDLVTSLSANFTQGLAISGETVYVGNTGVNIYSFDMASPSPALVSTIAGFSNSGLTASPTTVYVSRNNTPGDIFSFHVANPVNPATLLTSMPAGTLAFQLGVAPTVIATKGLHGQTKKVANYLNSLPFSFFGLVTQPAQMTGKELQSSLKKVCPARLASSIFAADNALFAVSQVVEKHTRNQRFARLDRTYQIPPTTSLDLRAQLVDASPAVPLQQPACCPSEPCSIWIEGLGVFTRQQPQLQTPAFKTSTGGFVAALEAYGNLPNVIGGGLAYTHTHLKWKGGYGASTIEQEYGFVYGTFDITCDFYIDAAIWLELFQIHNHRRLAFPGFKATEHSDPKGFQFAPHIELGYDFDWCWFSLEPFAMCDWVSSWQHRFRETGHGFNFGVKGQYSGMIRTELGLRFYETIACRWGQIIIQEKTSYVNKEPFHVGTVNAFLVGAPGSFTVETLTASQNLGLVELEFLFTSTDMRYPYGSVGYQGEFGSSYISNQVILEIGQDF
jgi:hypothetical protein